MNHQDIVTDLVADLLLIPELHFSEKADKIAAELEAGNVEAVREIVFYCSGPCDPILRHREEVQSWLFKARRRIAALKAVGHG